MKLNGIYIPIRGDYTRFQADMAKARSIAREQGKAISDALGNAIGTDSATRGLSNLTRNLAQAQRALSGASFKGTIDGLDELARIRIPYAGAIGFTPAHRKHQCRRTSLYPDSESHRG